MYKIIALTSIFLIISACKPASFQSKPNIHNLSEITPAKAKSLEQFDSDVKAELSAQYGKANRPIFALLDGYYQLPNASAYGAAKLFDFSYQSYLKNIKLKKKERLVAISKLNDDEQAAMHEVMDTLLDMGVKLYEISVGDTATMSDAERNALKGKGKWNWALHLSPKKIDYFMSIYKTQAKLGSVLVGRVINKDGHLLAFRVMDFDGPAKINNLVLALFDDSINKLEKN